MESLLPVIPDSLAIPPLTLALLTASGFLDLAEREVDAEAARKVLERVGFYVQRLSDAEIERLSLDLERLSEHARAQRWPEEAREFIDNFLVYCGFALEDEEADDPASDDGDEEDLDDEGNLDGER